MVRTKVRMKDRQVEKAIPYKIRGNGQKRSYRGLGIMSPSCLQDRFSNSSKFKEKKLWLGDSSKSVNCNELIKLVEIFPLTTLRA